MFYRMKFDASIGAIFKHCGIDTSQAMEYWPIGGTKVGIAIGKSCGFSAQLAAIQAFVGNTFDNYKAGRLSAEQMKFFHTRLLNWVEICHKKYVGHAIAMIDESSKEIDKLDNQHSSQNSNSKTEASEWEKDGSLSINEVIKVHVLDPMGSYSKEWVIGEDVPADVVEKAKSPETNELYAFTVYKEGKPETNVVTYDFWLKIKTAMGE